MSLTVICYGNSINASIWTETLIEITFTIILTSIVWTVAMVWTISLNSPRTLPKRKQHLVLIRCTTFRFRENENNKTQHSLLLTGSFSCWRKWCTRSIFFTLPLFLTKNSRTEAWVIPSFADMLNLCGTGRISPSLLSEQIPTNFRHHHNYVQMHAGSSWSPRTSRAWSMYHVTAERAKTRVPKVFIWARSIGLARFPRSCLATLFLVKISMCSYERPGWPGYRDLGGKNRDLGNRDENFPIWTLQPGDRDETFSTK